MPVPPQAHTEATKMRRSAGVRISIIDDRAGRSLSYDSQRSRNRRAVPSRRLRTDDVANRAAGRETGAGSADGMTAHRKGSVVCRVTIALGPVVVDLIREVNQPSACCRIVFGARVVREVDAVVHRATESSKRLATLAVDIEVRFQFKKDRAAFRDDLTDAIATLVSR